MTFVPAMAQTITFVEHERGHFIDGDSVYYDSTRVFPTGMTPSQMQMLLGKKTLKKIAKIEKSQKKAKVNQTLTKSKQQDVASVPFADAKTFKSLRLYGVDSAHVFYRGSIIENADPVTFTKVEEPKGHILSYYYKDKNHVYYMGKILEGADPVTFRRHTITYSVDKNDVYVGELALGIDPDNYTLMGDAYIIGSGKVFYGYKAVNVNVNPDSFELLEEGYATDGQKIIYWGEQVDADAPTFRKLLFSDSVGYCHYGNCFYTDKHRLYYMGKPVEGTNSDSRIPDSIYKSVLENSSCRSRIINTDSVYSFLNAAHLDEIGFGHVFLLKSTPHPIHELKDVPGFRNFIDSIRVLETDDNPSVQEEVKHERERLISLFASVLDSTTTFSQPFTNWDISRLPEGWLLYNKNPIYDFIVATPWSEKTGYYNSWYGKRKSGGKNKKQRKVFKEGVEYAQRNSFKRRIDLSLSMPVFDKDYEYALLFVANNRSPKLEEACAFILYKRDSENGWEVYVSGNMFHYATKALNGRVLLRL